MIWNIFCTEKADFELPSMEPPVMELEIIAAFDDTEGAAPAHGDLDGDGDMKMSPQLIYTGRSIHRAASVYQYIYI